MSYSSCPGSLCKHYMLHRDVWKRDQNTGEFYQIPNQWRCHSARATERYKPMKGGGVKIGLVCWDCKGAWFEART